MSDKNSGALTREGALRFEYAIIGLGIVALILIFQPFSLTLFAVGGALVVLAGLVNNLLPLAQPGVKVRSIVVVALVVAMIFCIALLLSMTAAYLYGEFFLAPPDPNTIGGRAQLATAPFYLQSFTWWVAAVAVALAGAITVLNKAK